MKGNVALGGVFQSQIHTESPLYSYGHFPNFIPKFWHLYFSKTKCGDFKVNKKYETCSTIPSPSFWSGNIPTISWHDWKTTTLPITVITKTSFWSNCSTYCRSILLEIYVGHFKGRGHFLPVLIWWAKGSQPRHPMPTPPPLALSLVAVRRGGAYINSCLGLYATYHLLYI